MTQFHGFLRNAGVHREPKHRPGTMDYTAPEKPAVKMKLFRTKEQMDAGREQRVFVQAHTLLPLCQQ